MGNDPMIHGVGDNPRRPLVARKLNWRCMRAHKNRLLQRADDHSWNIEPEAVHNSRLFQRVTEVIGSGAQVWMRTPLPVLGNATPSEAARTERGLAKVLAVLDQLEHGVY